jgi:hypothetical protein
MQHDEECDYDHTLIDDYGALGGDKDNCRRQFKHVQEYCHRDGIHAIVS